MIIVDLEQGSQEWFEAKIGIPSSSKSSNIVTTSGVASKSQEGYLYELASEAVTGKREETYKNAIMETGNEREAESRSYFEAVHDVEIKQTGVIYKDEEKSFLCSPDGLVLDKECGLELKNPLPKTQAKYLMNGTLPTEYFCQVQTSMYVTGYKHWWFMSYVPNMRPLILKVERDDVFLGKFDTELKKFNAKLKEIIEKIK